MRDSTRVVETDHAFQGRILMEHAQLLKRQHVIALRIASKEMLGMIFDLACFSWVSLGNKSRRIPKRGKC